MVEVIRYSLFPITYGGNEARKEFVSIQLPKRDPGAARIYSKEVASLDHKLQEAYKNVPLERLANIKASLAMKSWKELNPGASFSEKQKEASKALTRARRDVGASRYDIQITPKEWEAIQKNAISPSKLEKILPYLSCANTCNSLFSPQ